MCVDDEVTLALFVYPQLVEFGEFRASCQSAEQIHGTWNKVLVNCQKSVQWLEISTDANFSRGFRYIDCRESADIRIHWFQYPTLDTSLQVCLYFAPEVDGWAMKRVNF